jgi:heat shock protein HtpX
MNMMKTTVLLAALTGLMVVVGDAIGGQQGMVMALVFAGLLNFVSFFFSDKIVLSMYRARPVTQAEAPELHGSTSCPTPR